MSEVILKAVEDLGVQVKAQVDGVKQEVKDATETATKAAEDTKVEIKAIKDEYDLKLKAVNDEMTEIKKKGGRIGQGFADEYKSFDDQLKEAILENTDNIEKMARKDSGRKDFVIELKAVGDVSIANYTGGTRGLTTLRGGIIMNPPRKLHMRDIISPGTIGPGTEYVFMKENGEGEGAIASVAEGGTKPQIDVDLIEASVKIETIAGWLRVTRKAMSNVPGFVSFLQARLPEKLLRVEDNLILNGDGVTPNIKGIQVAGNFTAASGAATINIEQLVQAISQLEELEREATGIVVRPSDYYSMLLLKDSQNAYTQPGIVTVTPDGVLRVLGIPVVKTTAQTVDKFLVGDFRMGAQFLIQEGMRIEFFEQDGDNVRTNKVTVRIEETVALPVYGADYFIFGDFGDVA